MITGFLASRFSSLQDLYMRSEKWYRTLRRMLRTSGLQSFKVLYCGGTDWGRPSLKFPEPPGDQQWQIESRACFFKCVAGVRVVTWVFYGGRRRGPRWAVAAASRDLSDVFTLEGSYECGLLYWVGVSKAKLETEQSLKCYRYTTKTTFEGLWCSNTASLLPYLTLTVAAPGIDVPSGGQGKHMFTAHSNVFYKQPVQRRHNLGKGFILQHGVRQPNEAF